VLRPPTAWRVNDEQLEAYVGVAPSQLEVQVARELAWRTKSEWEIREAMEAAVRRRLTRLLCQPKNGDANPNRRRRVKPA
jgi:hypothetical protein